MAELKEVLAVADRIEQNVEKNNGKLSDHDIQTINDTMKELSQQEAPEPLAVLAPSEDGHSESVTVNVNLENGSRFITQEEENAPSHATDVLEKAIDTGIMDDLLDTELNEKLIAQTYCERYGKLAPVVEMNELNQLIQDYQKDHTIKVYNRLPQTIKRMMTTQLLGDAGKMSVNYNKAMLEATAKDFIEDFIGDAAMNSCMVDFQKEMDNLGKEFNASMQELTEQGSRDQLEKFRMTADILAKNGEDDKAEKFNNVADIIENALSLSTFKEEVLSGKIKVRKYEVEHPKNAFMNFYRKYENSLWNIYDIALVPRILQFVFPEEDPKKINWFAVALANHLQPYDETKTEDHAYMYNTILAIIWLRMGDLTTDQNKRTIDTIKEILDSRY